MSDGGNKGSITDNDRNLAKLDRLSSSVAAHAVLETSGQT